MRAEFGGPRGVQLLRADGGILREKQPLRRQGFVSSVRQALGFSGLAAEPKDDDRARVGGAQDSQ